MPTVIIEGPKADTETKRELVRRITDGELDPHSAAEEVLAGLLR